MVFHQECTMYTFRFHTDDIKYAFVEEQQLKGMEYKNKSPESNYSM